MAEEKKFVEGIYLKPIQTKFGTMTKVGIDYNKFAKFMKQLKDEGYLNEDGFLNFLELDSKKGGKYMIVDEFKPDSNKGQKGEGGGGQKGSQKAQQEDDSDDLPF